jgi:Cu(I)/Ag(I) efflux system membrane protein CusA/SilA
MYLTPLAPDGTGVGHIFLVSSGNNGMDLGEQRALQDWYVKFAYKRFQVLLR